MGSMGSMGSMGCWPGGIASIGVETAAGRLAASHPDRGISTSDRPSRERARPSKAQQGPARPSKAQQGPARPCESLRRPALLGLAPGTCRISMTSQSLLDAFIEPAIPTLAASRCALPRPALLRLCNLGRQRFYERSRLDPTHQAESMEVKRRHLMGWIKMKKSLIWIMSSRQ
ncbi:uncharacterized protein PG986_003821 [Apiospora aurea]|uniref:Uncharacterized protein n=1 Tax=Apiospora aurea TaxID=335848 RepID=A0ABR1QUB8_9PEZI